ncbi:MAG: Fe-S protein assembly co-chaperone HscB [Acidobacteria bacterium]|nr:Fe-S protein assembly co-chaperone HscB [Acidobacteriota bacterium]
MAEPTTQATPAARGAVCWDCGAAAAGEHFCPACGKIQPQPPAQDYFAFLGLGRKLNLARNTLEQKFHELSWKLHPDHFTTATPYERDLSLEKAAVLNDAYRTLRDPIARVEYLLGLEGVRREGEIRQQAPPDLLEDVFQLNEYLEELRAAKRAGGDAKQLDELRHRLETARLQFEAKLEAVNQELEQRFAEWDALVEAADAAARRQKMEEMSEILNRHSYLRNLVRNVEEELES